MNHESIEKYILEMPNTVLDYPFGEGVAVYKVGGADGKMFALIAEGSSPLRLSLKCDPQLAVVLREKYESVMPGYHLNKKHWNTVIIDDSIPENEIYKMIDESYSLVYKGLNRKQQEQINSDKTTETI